MLDRSEYYHGAAIIHLLEDKRCRAVRKFGSLGYVVNEETVFFLKYTTKVRSPWGFYFNQQDLDRCFQMTKEYKCVVLGLICGGDGICSLNWSEVQKLLNGNPGRIVARRKHNESYAVRGTVEELKRKVPLSRWPALLFEWNELA